jgi:glycosyltransferase involved in cell wall biosynthesis
LRELATLGPTFQAKGPYDCISRMNVLYVIEGDGGGAATHVLKLAEGLSEMGVSARIAFMCEGPSVRQAGKLGLRYSVVKKTMSLDIRPVLGLLSILEKHDVDIIHSHTIRGNFYARMAVLLYRRPLKCLTTVHSHIVDELKGKGTFGPWDWLLWKREKLAWSKVDHFICVSDGLRRRLLSNGVPDERMSVVVNGVEVPDLTAREKHRESVREELSLQDDEILVTTVGRLVPVKNHILFLQAARDVVKAKKVTFLIVGDGVLFHALKTKTKAWNLADSVFFTGWRNDVDRILCATDIYVITSVVEGLNLSVLEAMACGVPIVGTDVRGISDIVVDKENGFLAPLNDVNALANAILTLADNRELSERMGRNGRQLVEQRYSVQTMVAKTLRVYEDLHAIARNEVS